MCFYCIVGNLMDGRRLCTTCLYYKPIDDFKRRDVKRQDPTKMCTGCRDIAKKSSRKPTSGPEALAKELAKCQALCRACHRMEHSWRSKPKSPNALFVDAVGECECGSGCGKKVTHRSKR